MTAAILAAAGALVLAVVLLAVVLVTRARADRRAGATPMVAARVSGYDHLGRGGQSAAGGGSPDTSIHSGETDLPDGPAFVGVVVDGIGESAAGERIRSVAMEAFLSGLEGGAGGLETRLRSALDAAHSSVRQAAEEAGLEAGASLSAAVIGRDGLHWISIGNTRIYLCRDGVLHQVTCDQTFGAILAQGVMREQLSPEEAAAKQEREAVTSYVGGADPLRFDASRRPLPLSGGDRVIVCTHGLHGRLGCGDIVEILQSSEGGCSEALVARALRASSANPPAIGAVDFLFDPREAALPSPAVERRRPESSTVRMEEATGETARARAG